MILQIQLAPGEGLFSTDFYKNVYRILTKDGILVTQSESPRFNQKVFVEIFKCYQSIFGENSVSCYLASIPTYPTGTWSFSISCKNKQMNPKNVEYKKIKALCDSNSFSYYNEDIHFAAFALPNFVKAMLQ